MRNIQIVNKQIAREKNLPEDLVEKVNSLYWKEARRALSSMDYSSVSLKHLGTITTSRRKLVGYITELIGKIRSLRKSVRYKESTRLLLIDIYYERLNKALIQRNILATQYYVEGNKGIFEVDSHSMGEQGESDRRDDESSENGDEYAPGGRAGGDSQEETDMCELPI